ncbi:MAG: T9SS C-terminal target domain-containing protein, partial [Cytophagales bacterium]
ATPINYTAKDELPLSSLAYYRLKSVDNDGSIQYSNWVAVKNSQKLQVKIYPNPAQDYVVIEGDESLDKAKVVLLSIEGQIIKETDFSKAVTLQLNELPKGLYILKIIGKMQISHHKIIVE